jgi:DNA-binding transcriptional LysR family regulator
VFRAVMLTGSISGAARVLAVSQPAVSRLLAYTEDRLGLQLFARIKGRLKPTPEARQLFEEVDQVYQGVQRVNDLAQNLLNRSSGRVSVVSSPSIGEAVVPRAVARFRRTHPDVQIEINTLTLSELVRQVATNQADIGLSAMPVDHPNVIASVLAESRLVCVCRADHPLAPRVPAGMGVRAEDLAPYPLISYGEETPYGMFVKSFLAGCPVALKISTLVRFVPMACALAEAGAGVAFADEFVLAGRTWPDVVAVPVEPAVPMRLYLLIPRDAPPSRLARAFCDTLGEVVPRPAGGRRRQIP